jgi:hypothetical protein
MNRRLLWLLAAPLLLIAWAQDTKVEKATIDDAVNKLTKDSIREIVSVIASDEYEGRCAGFKGNDMTADFFAKIYAKAGLKPVGDKDDKDQPTYLQHFTIQGRRTQNTVAFLEGTDPKLKDEIVVIGAHHDHLGKGNQGPIMQKLGGPTDDDNIWNGADDNGSGSSTVVAMAKAFGESGVKPRRSILFMTFSGEEWGLLGSAHYVSHPIFPIKKTVAMINIDMIGRNPNKPVGAHGLGTDESGLYEKLVDRFSEKTGLKVKKYQEHTVMGGDSDHSNFIHKGVPAMFFFSGMHPDYHKVSDHVDKLAFDHMEQIGRTVMMILWELANGDAKPGFSKKAGASRFPGFDWPKDDEKPEPKTRRLGFLPGKLSADQMDEMGLGKDEGGILVERVTEDTLADKAGLKNGDVILSFDGKTLPRSDALKTLRSTMNAAKAKTPITIVVLRGKEKKELKVEFPE